MKLRIEIEVPDKVLSDFIESSLTMGKEDKEKRTKLMGSIIHRVGMKLESKLKAQLIKIITQGESNVIIVQRKK